MGMTKGQFSVLSFAAIAALSASGAAFAQAEPPIQRGGTAILTLTQEPPTLNPVITSGVPDRTMGCILYEPLIQVTPEYKIQPVLAKSYTISPDGLTYTFELNKANWHDGKPFTSDDVKYSILEGSVKYGTVFAAAGKEIESIETPAPDKVIFKLKQTFGPFLLSLACSQGGAILPAHVFRGTEIPKNPATTATPIGTGAFKLGEWKRGEYVKVVKNTDYFIPGKPYLDAVIGKIITQTGARIQALQGGEVDIVSNIAANDIAAINANPKLKVLNSDTSSQSGIMMYNQRRKPLDDKRVRQALFIATDRDYLMKNVFFNVGTIGTQPMTTDIPWLSNPDVDYRKMYPYDIAKANALLDAAGAKRGADGKRMTLKMLTFGFDYPEMQQAAIAMKSMWQAVGVDMQIEGLERTAFIQKVFKEYDYDITMQVYGSFYDPALGIARTWATSSQGDQFGNPMGYSNPKLDELFEKGKRGTSFDERGVFYKQAQAILADELPSLQLRQYVFIDAASKRLHGVWGKMQSTAGLWSEAWLEQ